jgi:membrane protein required for colicin V production
MSHRVSEQVKKSEIGPIDRTLGFVFGVGRGLVIVGFAYIAFAALVPARDHPDTLTKARLFPLIRNTSDVLRSLTPEESTGAAAAEAKSPTPQPTAAKAYGADDRSALDRLFETKGSDGTPAR